MPTTLLDIPASLELDLSNLMVMPEPMPAMGSLDPLVATWSHPSVVEDGSPASVPAARPKDMPPGATSSTTPAGILQHDSDALPGPSVNGSEYGPDDDGFTCPRCDGHFFGRDSVTGIVYCHGGGSLSAEEIAAGKKSHACSWNGPWPPEPASTEQVIPSSAAGDTVLPDVGDIALPLPQTPAPGRVFHTPTIDYGFPTSPEAARLAEIIEAQQRVDTAKIVVDRLKEDLKDAKESWEQRVSELGFLIKSGLERLPLFDSPAARATTGQPTSLPPTEAPEAGVLVLGDDSPFPGLCISKPTEDELEIGRKMALELRQLAAESLEAAGDQDAWRYHKVEELGLKPSLTERLTNEAICTVGQLEDLRAEVSTGQSKWPKGVGPAKVTEIENAVVGWLGRWHEKHDGAATGQE